MRKILKSEELSIVKKRKSGATIAQLAGLFGCSEGKIKNVLNAHAIPTKTKPYKRKSPAELAADRLQDIDRSAKAQGLFVALAVGMEVHVEYDDMERIKDTQYDCSIDKRMKITRIKSGTIIQKTEYAVYVKDRYTGRIGTVTKNDLICNAARVTMGIEGSEAV